MYCKISAPDKVIYDGDIVKITVPTEAGEITILPNHQPLASVVKTGLVAITPKGDVMHGDDFIIEQGKILIALSRGMLMVDGKHVIITSSAATTSPDQSQDMLKKMQATLQEELEKIKIAGNKEDIEAAIMNLEKVTADLRLVKFKEVG